MYSYADEDLVSSLTIAIAQTMRGKNRHTMMMVTTTPAETPTATPSAVNISQSSSGYVLVQEPVAGAGAGGTLEELVEVDRRRKEELDRPQSAESVPVAQRLGSSQSPSLVYGQEAPQFELECEHEHVALPRRREEEVLTDPDPQSAFEQVQLHVELLVLDELRQALPAASISQHAMPNGSSINTSKRLVPKNPFDFMLLKLCPIGVWAFGRLGVWARGGGRSRLMGRIQLIWIHLKS